MYSIILCFSPASSKLLSSGRKQCIIFDDLYNDLPARNILEVLSANLNPCFELRPDDPETTIFLAELSYALVSDWITVARYLLVRESTVRNLETAYGSRNINVQAEASFKMMMEWLKTACDRTLRHLLCALHEVGVVVSVQQLSRAQKSECEDIPFYELPDRVNDIRPIIASQWKFVGRLLGLTETRIYEAAATGGADPYYQLMEQTVAMLEMWKKICGNEATFLRLKNAIYALHEHSGCRYSDAVHLLQSF